MSAPSPADAPCDGRPSASAARSHRPAPLEAARHRFGAASLSRAALASGGPTMPARQPLKPARPWWDRGGRSPHPWRAPSRWPARPCAPCRARAAAGRSRRRVQLFPRRVRRERPRVSGAFGPASRTCRRLFLFFGWVPGPAAAARRRARVGSKNNVRSPRREAASRRFLDTPCAAGVLTEGRGVR